MNQRLIIGFLLASLSYGCGGGASTGGSGGKTTTGSGGAPTTGSGGASTTGSGGASTTGSGGASTTGTGGASTTGSGGASTTGTGGASTTGSGGSGAGTGGAGGRANTGGSGTATGGAGGRANTGGGPATGGSGTATGGAGGAPASTGSVLERNKNPSRDGHFLQPTITKAAAGMMAPDTKFNMAATFSGAVLGGTLYLDGSPGKFFTGTVNGDVIARNENGTMAWAARNIGAPATNNIGCSSFRTTPPLGILSTGAIDATSKTVYMAGITGSASGVTGQIVSAINADDGTVRTGWPVNASTAAMFDPVLHNQRSALSLVNGILYIPYAGYVGDCGAYHGRVVAINTATPTMVGQWATAGTGEGIWAMGGLASDGNGVVAVTGNRTSGSGGHQDSEQVTRITGMGTKADYYYPADWQDKDSSDADFGSVNAMFINVTGATPANLVAAISKDGHLYLLDAAMLRGTTSGTAAGGHKLDFTVASSGMSIHTVPASYKTAMGTYVVLSTTSGAQGCPAGGTGSGGRRVMGIRITPSPLAATVAWCAEMQTNTTGPIATTTDGTANAIVWYTSNGALRGVDGDTGATVYSSTDSCMGVAKWTSPIAVKGRIVVAGNGRLCAWGIPGALTP